MSGTSYRQAFRARRFVILATTLLVTALAVLLPPTPVSYSTPSTVLEHVADPAYAKYEATAVLGVPPIASGGNAQTQFKTIAFYLQSTAVGEVFAQKINYTGDDLAMLGRLVTIETDPLTGIFTVKGFGGTKKQAADITNAFTSSLRDYLSGLGTQATEQSIKQAQASVDGLKQRINDLGVQIDQLRATLPAGDAALNPQVAQLQAEHDALISSYTAAYQHLASVSGGGATPATAGLAVLQEATARRAVKQAPSLLYLLSLRILLGVVVGLGLGAALALLLEHNARKIFTRESAERAFGARVLVEVPRQRLTGTARDVAVISAPRSRAAAAYRMLRVLLLAAPSANGDGSGRLARHSRPVPVLAGVPELPAAATTLESEDLGHHPVAESSTLRADGTGTGPSSNGSSAARGGAADSPSGESYELGGARSLALVVAATANEPAHPAVVANLAAAFAGSGRSVTVLRIAPSARRRSSDADDDVPEGRPATRDTSIAGVRVVDWEPVYGGASAAEVVQILREDHAVVLVDTGRVATAEFAEVAPVIDGVVTVCQVGRTTIENAERTSDIVAWSHARLLGVVLAQVPNTPVERATWGRWRRSPLTSRRGSGDLGILPGPHGEDAGEHDAPSASSSEETHK